MSLPSGARHSRRVVLDRQSKPVKLSTTLFGESYSFASLKEVLAKANEPRSGDVQAGLACTSMREMAAAKLVLSDVSMKELRENPAVPYEHDEVTRVVEDAMSHPLAA